MKFTEWQKGIMTVTAQDGRRFVDLPVCIAAVPEDGQDVKVWPMNEAANVPGITSEDMRYGKFWFPTANIESWTPTPE